MDVDQIRNELSDNWDTDELEGDGIVAELDSGELITIEAHGMGFLINTVRDLTINGYRVRPVTNSEMYNDRAKMLAFVAQTAEYLEDDDISLRPIALLPHNGDPESVDTTLADPTKDIDSIDDYPFADVLAVYTDEQPESVDMNYFRNIATDIADVIYGRSGTIPDTFHELQTKGEAYDNTTIEVFTVGKDDLERIDQDDDSRGRD